MSMGAAGLTSSSFEMAGRAGTGIRLNLDNVPVRESGMTPYEIMLSESQERMLIVAKRGREQDVIRIFEKWDLNAAIVGEVTDDGFVRVFSKGDEVAGIPVDPISTEAPVYNRPLKRPAYIDQVQQSLQRERAADGEITDDFLRLIASPNLCSKHWIWEQYDTTVRTNTIAQPERRDAAIVRVKGTGRALAMTSDVNPVYCYLDPYEGGKQAVAEAARNIAASGGRPVAITDCLNFGSPERPEIMWQFAECIRGISDACNALSARRSSPAMSRSTTRPKDARSIRRRPSAWSASWSAKTSDRKSTFASPVSTSFSSAKRATSWADRVAADFIPAP